MIGAILKTPRNPIAKCAQRCRAPGAGLPPHKFKKFRKFRSFRKLACTISRRPFGSEKSHFSSDSSRKWQSLWLVGENLDRSWQAPRSCWWMLGSVSKHHSHSYATIPRFGFAHLVEIEERATGHVILLMDFPPLSRWDTTYMLQIVLIHHGMKLMNTLCLSLFCYWCFARRKNAI